MDTFDLIIIGSGSGNAIPPEFSDWKIALVERGTFGGTCLNVGCIPSKMFVLPADVAEAARHGRPPRRSTTAFDGVDWPAIRDRVFNRIDPIAAGGEPIGPPEPRTSSCIRGPPGSSAPRELRRRRPQDQRAERILVAAGSRTTMPPDPRVRPRSGSTRRTRSCGSTRQPDRLAIIGGGFIAIEMGHVFAGLRVEGHAVQPVERAAANGGPRDRSPVHRGVRPAGRASASATSPSRSSRWATRSVSTATARPSRSTNCWWRRAASRTPTWLDVTPAASNCTRTVGSRSTTRMATSVDGVWAIGDVAATPTS